MLSFLASASYFDKSVIPNTHENDMFYPLKRNLHFNILNTPIVFILQIYLYISDYDMGVLKDIFEVVI